MLAPVAEGRRYALLSVVKSCSVKANTIKKVFVALDPAKNSAVVKNRGVLLALLIIAPLETGRY